MIPRRDATLRGPRAGRRGGGQGRRRQEGLLVQPEPLGQRQGRHDHRARARHPQPGRASRSPRPRRTKYGNAWSWLVSQLGDGVDATIDQPNTETATVNVTNARAEATTLNDYGYTAGASTKVGDAQRRRALRLPRRDARDACRTASSSSTTRTTPAGGQPQRIVAWTDLTKQASSTHDAGRRRRRRSAGRRREPHPARPVRLVEGRGQRQAGDAGVAGLRTARTTRSSPTPTTPTAGASTRSPTPSWSTCSRTAPTPNAVILFGGTWCPNTRPVVGFVNKYAQQNGVRRLQLRHRPRRRRGRRRHDVDASRPAAVAQHRQQRRRRRRRTRTRPPSTATSWPVPDEHQDRVQARRRTPVTFYRGRRHRPAR